MNTLANQRAFNKNICDAYPNKKIINFTESRRDLMECGRLVERDENTFGMICGQSACLDFKTNQRIHTKGGILIFKNRKESYFYPRAIDGSLPVPIRKFVEEIDNECVVCSDEGPKEVICSECGEGVCVICIKKYFLQKINDYQSTHRHLTTLPDCISSMRATNNLPSCPNCRYPNFFEEATRDPNDC